ncbi:MULTISPECIES: hypothetical protein [unclassified Streptomyces]|nr:MULTISPECIES: hypothetical protein [unclassified Streptomyces]
MSSTAGPPWHCSLTLVVALGGDSLTQQRQDAGRIPASKACV